VTVDPAAAGLRDELLLSLARELLANAARHAHADRVDVGVHLEPDAILLRVSDDGAGFAPGRVEQALAGGAIGIASCRERVEAVSGSLTVRSAPGGGTLALARIPLAATPSGPDRVGIYPLDGGSDRA